MTTQTPNADCLRSSEKGQSCGDAGSPSFLFQGKTMESFQTNVALLIEISIVLFSPSSTKAVDVVSLGLSVVPAHIVVVTKQLKQI